MSSSSSIIYVLISKDPDTILANFTEHVGNFEVISTQILRKVTKNHNGIIIYQKYKFHYINLNGITIMSMSDYDYKDDVVICFLEEVFKEFQDTFSQREIENSSQFSFDQTFQPCLKNKMSYYNKNPVADSISLLKGEVIKFRNNVIQAYDLLGQRGELLQEIDAKAKSLATESVKYYSEAKRVKNRVWWQKWYFILVLIVILLLIIYLLFGFFCGFGFECFQK